MPPARPAPRASIVYPRPAQPIEALVLGPTWTGCQCHWIPACEGRPARSLLCERPDHCIGCIGERPVKWHAYLPIIVVSRLNPAILTLTQSGILSLLDAVGKESCLRGEMMIFSRSSSHTSSPVRVERSPKRWTKPVPAEFDVLHSLEGVYGTAAIQRWRERTERKDGAQ